MASRRILVLGASGMLGRRCVERFSREPGWIVGESTRRSADALFFDGTAERLGAIMSRRWDYVVNCAGMLASAIDPSNCGAVGEAIRINALLPHELATLGAAYGTRIIHISTDGVFSGACRHARDEGDAPCVSDVYGGTKLLGECAATNAITLRCSIVGNDQTRRRGLVEWFLGMPVNSAASGYTNQRFNPVTTGQYADLCASMISNDGFDAVRSESFVHHFCPNPGISKYDFLLVLQRLARPDVDVRPVLSDSPQGRVLTTKYSTLRELYSLESDWNEIARTLLNERA